MLSLPRAPAGGREWSGGAEADQGSSTLSISGINTIIGSKLAVGSHTTTLHFTLTLPLQRAGGGTEPPDHQPYLSSRKRKQQAKQERKEAGLVQRGVGGAEGLEERIGAMSI